MSAATAIQGQADRIAKGRQTMQSAFSTGTDFWSRVDAAADETYENRIKGTDVTAMDSALEDGAVWTTAALKQWFTLHNTYFQTDLSLASPYIDSYLASQGWRVPFEFAECWAQAVGSRIDDKYVFPKGTTPADASDPSTAGLHKFMDGTDVGTVETYTAEGGLGTYSTGMVVVTSGTDAPGGTGHKLTLTLTDNATTRDVSYTPATYQYGQAHVGVATISPCTTGDVTITLSTTAQFAAGCDVLIATATTFSNPEVVTVGTVTASTLQFTTAIKNDRVTGDYVVPLVKNAIYKAGTLDTGKSITAYAWPDRTIAL